MSSDFFQQTPFMSHGALVLFDVDGTLISNQGQGHKPTFATAIKKVFGITVKLESIDYDGLTDPLIVIELLKQQGVSESAIQAKLPACLEAMVEVYQEIVKANPPLSLPGVLDLLKVLQRRQILVGLATGMLEPIARLKLKAAGLNEFFPFGGFGSNANQRAAIIALVISQVERNFKFRWCDNILLVGDTPRDIAAGKTTGIKTLGVSTGKYSERELAAAGADFVAKDLTDTKAIIGLMLNFNHD